MRLNHRYQDPAKRLIGWSQKAKDRELAVSSPTNKHFPLNPVDSITLKVQPMDTRNEVTLSCSQLVDTEQVLTASIEKGGIESEAKALL
jgi:hypothetical protein